LNPERWQRVDALFQTALASLPEERPALLAEVCASDEALRREVESLLASYGEAGDFIETPAFDAGIKLFAPERDDQMTGRLVGPYRVLREIGRGGMGAVYLALRDDEQYRKHVAVKLIKRGMDSDFIVRRFRNERQILANLDHPNVAKLLDGGVTEDGRPYFVMEYVEGRPVNEYCDAQKLPVEARLELFRQVCSAVHYAHQNLVIHRDIKPSNILVTAEGRPVLLDFGVAKLLGPELSLQTQEHTATVLRLMTPEYASPEQVRGAAITTTSDVYSLGVLLYELLSGQRPYRLKSRSPDEIARAICDEEPERPSDALGKEAFRVPTLVGSFLRRKNPATVGALNALNPKSLRGDLDNIVLMAMRKEPERRYSSVAQFSEDIRRYLEGLPVIARKDTLVYRGGKFVKRHKAGVTVAAIIALILVGGVGGIVWQARAAARAARVAAEERDRERVEAAKAERINAFLQDIFSYAVPGPGRGKSTDVKVVDALDEAGRRIETELNDEPEVKAELHQTIAHTYNALRLFDEAEHHAQAALKLKREIYGEQSFEVGQQLAYVGGVFLVKGDYATASSYYEKALTILRALPQSDDVLLANLLREYAAAQRLSGNVQDSVPLYREALDLFRKHDGDESESVAVVYNDLACVYFDQDEWDEAIVNDERSLAIYRKLPSRSPAMVQTLGVLGAILEEKGEYKRAEALTREALDLRRQALGENHPDVANSLADLGWLAFLQHDYAAAEAEENEALEIYRKHFPEMNMLGAAGPLENLAKMRLQTGQPRRAEPYLREALDIKTRLLPKGNWMVAADEGLLGECLTMQKRYAEAEPLLVESHQSLKASRGDKHGLTQDALKRLVKLYEAWGKPEMAARFRQAALGIDILRDRGTP
jgi:serine/threonine-protein kinase